MILTPLQALTNTFMRCFFFALHNAIKDDTFSGATSASNQMISFQSYKGNQAVFPECNSHLNSANGALNKLCKDVAPFISISDIVQRI